MNDYEDETDDNIAYFEGSEVTILATYVRSGKKIVLIRNGLGEEIEVYSELLEY